MCLVEALHQGLHQKHGCSSHMYNLECRRCRHSPVLECAVCSRAPCFVSLSGVLQIFSMCGCLIECSKDLCGGRNAAWDGCRFSQDAVGRSQSSRVWLTLRGLLTQTWACLYDHLRTGCLFVRQSIPQCSYDVGFSWFCVWWACLCDMQILLQFMQECCAPCTLKTARCV